MAGLVRAPAGQYADRLLMKSANGRYGITGLWPARCAVGQLRKVVEKHRLCRLPSAFTKRRAFRLCKRKIRDELYGRSSEDLTLS